MPKQSAIEKLIEVRAELGEQFTLAVEAIKYATIHDLEANERIVRALMEYRGGTPVPAPAPVATPPKKRGRTPGSKNRPKVTAPTSKPVKGLDELPSLNDPAFPDEQYYVGGKLFRRTPGGWEDLTSK